jgi:hypothetical protein
LQAPRREFIVVKIEDAPWPAPPAGTAAASEAALCERDVQLLQALDRVRAEMRQQVMELTDGAEGVAEKTRGRCGGRGTLVWPCQA